MEGWDEALHEIGRLSYETVLSSQNATSLLKAVDDLPILVIAGAEDALVSLKSAQVMASKLVNSVSIALITLFLSKDSFRHPFDLLKGQIALTTEGWGWKRHDDKSFYLSNEFFRFAEIGRNIWMWPSAT